jgi:hypothetical protein
MAKFAKGAVVQQIVKPITGIVDGDFRVDQETGDVQIPVRWLDEAGVEHARYFKEDEIELAPTSN